MATPHLHAAPQREREVQDSKAPASATTRDCLTGTSWAQMEIIWRRLHADFTHNYVMLTHTHSHIASSGVPFPLTRAVPRSENGGSPEGTLTGILGTQPEPKAGPANNSRPLTQSGPASRTAAAPQLQNLEHQRAESLLKAQEGVAEVSEKRSRVPWSGLFPPLPGAWPPVAGRGGGKGGCPCCGPHSLTHTSQRGLRVITPKAQRPRIGRL